MLALTQLCWRCTASATDPQLLPLDVADVPPDRLAVSAATELPPQVVLLVALLHRRQPPVAHDLAVHALRLRDPHHRQRLLTPVCTRRHDESQPAFDGGVQRTKSSLPTDAHLINFPEPLCDIGGRRYWSHREFAAATLFTYVRKCFSSDPNIIRHKLYVRKYAEFGHCAFLIC